MHTIFRIILFFGIVSFWGLSAEEDEFLSSAEDEKFEYELSICMIFNDEAPYLKEWIEYHLLVGVQHFYLCNHNSQDNFREVLAPYIEKGIVDLEEIYDASSKDPLVNFIGSVQMPYYNRCIEKTKGKSRWIALIDSDEFLVPVKANSLLDLLEEYRDCAGIGVNWQMFGTSHCPKIGSKELLIEKLTRCAHWDYPTNIHIKSIVQPLYAISVATDPHSIVYYPDYSTCNTNRESFTGPFSPSILIDQIRLNHYWTRDEDYCWNNKFNRNVNRDYISRERFEKVIDEMNVSEDTTILRFAPELKSRMFEKD